MDIQDCSGAILAGGFSSRMGKDKAALLFGGMTLLEWQVQKLRALGIGDRMVSGSTMPVSETRFIPDIYPHRGPLGGIHACLNAARHENVLFLAVDTPLVPLSALRLLAEAHTGGITLLCRGGADEILIGIYSVYLASAAKAILHTSASGVYRLAEHTTVRRVEFPGEAALLMNCNTPEAYRAAWRIACGQC